MSEKSEWQVKAKFAGLSQRALAELLGCPEMTIHRQISGRLARGVPQHLKAVVVAWELMDHGQREAWRQAMVREANKTGPGNHLPNDIKIAR